MILGTCKSRSSQKKIIGFTQRGLSILSSGSFEMNSFLEKLKAKKAKETADRALELMQQHVLQTTALTNALFSTAELEAPTKESPKGGEAFKKAFSRMALFSTNSPSDPTEAAALLVAAFGYDGASDRCKDLADLAVDFHGAEESHAWEMAGEIIGQMLEKENAANKAEAIKNASSGTGESFALTVTLNERQLAAKDMAFAGKSFCLIGPAGSGKTTAQRSIAGALHESGRLSYTTFKDVGGGTYTAPSIAFVAFTRRAAGNLRKAIHKDPVLANIFNGNIMTIHALLEYAPEYYWCSIEGKQKFRFAPRRTAKNPLTITHLVVEESSMVGAHDLWQVLYDALPPNVQIIFIGDINQLPPVFGPSILNYALIQLPIVELVEVYRNQGMVLENAHNILGGKPLTETPECNVIRGNKPMQLPQDKMGNQVLPKLFETLYNQIGEDGFRAYDPEFDIVLSPFNKQGMGTTNMNAWLAQFIGDQREAIVYEVLAGFNKVYLAVGDKVMVNKRDGIVTAIARNPEYSGREPQLPGRDLSRFGVRIFDRANDFSLDDIDDPTIDYSNFSLEALENQEAERKQQASHIVTVMFEDGYEENIQSAGEFGDQVFSLGYCLTTHKAQGSEWRKVYILMHKDHSTMLFREWLYTAYTRARIGVTIIAKDYLIEKAIKTPRILGNTLKDKLAYFNSGINNSVDVQCTKTAALPYEPAPL
jgi:energy-coupling factor transporter ATP-binding protein EcfA2